MHSHETKWSDCALACLTPLRSSWGFSLFTTHDAVLGTSKLESPFYFSPLFWWLLTSCCSGCCQTKYPSHMCFLTNQNLKIFFLLKLVSVVRDYIFKFCLLIINNDILHYRKHILVYNFSLNDYKSLAGLFMPIPEISGTKAAEFIKNCSNYQSKIYILLRLFWMVGTPRNSQDLLLVDLGTMWGVGIERHA